MAPDEEGGDNNEHRLRVWNFVALILQFLILVVLLFSIRVGYVYAGRRRFSGSDGYSGNGSSSEKDEGDDDSSTDGEDAEAQGGGWNDSGKNVLRKDKDNEDDRESCLTRYAHAVLLLPNYYFCLVLFGVSVSLWIADHSLDLYDSYYPINPRSSLYAGWRCVYNLAVVFEVAIPDGVLLFLLRASPDRTSARICFAAGMAWGAANACASAFWMHPVPDLDTNDELWYWWRSAWVLFVGSASLVYLGMRKSGFRERRGVVFLAKWGYISYGILGIAALSIRHASKTLTTADAFVVWRAVYCILSVPLLYHTLRIDSLYWSNFGERGKATGHSSREDPLVLSPRLRGKIVDYRTLRVLKKIGSGSSAIVRKGILGGRPVAVKTAIFAEITRESVDDILQESEFLSRLSHPNIVAFIGVSLAPPDVHMIVELCTCSLLQLMMKFQPETLQRSRLVRLFADIARGLTYLHGKGIVHRDLKPANILIGEEGGAKLCDFASCLQRYDFFSRWPVFHLRAPSWRFQELSTDRPAGTATYMAPEVLRGDAATSASDMHSLGVLMWELLAGGKDPWENATTFKKIKSKILSGYRPPLAITVAPKGEFCTSPSRPSHHPRNNSHLDLTQLPSGRAEWHDRTSAMLQQVILDCFDVRPEKRPLASQVLERIESIDIQPERSRSGPSPGLMKQLLY